MKNSTVFRIPLVGQLHIQFNSYLLIPRRLGTKFRSVTRGGHDVTQARHTLRFTHVLYVSVTPKCAFESNGEYLYILPRPSTRTVNSNELELNWGCMGKGRIVNFCKELLQTFSLNKEVNTS